MSCTQCPPHYLPPSTSHRTSSLPAPGWLLSLSVVRRRRPHLPVLPPTGRRVGRPAAEVCGCVPHAVPIPPLTSTHLSPRLLPPRGRLVHCQSVPTTNDDVVSAATPRRAQDGGPAAAGGGEGGVCCLARGAYTITYLATNSLSSTPYRLPVAFFVCTISGSTLDPFKLLHFTYFPTQLGGHRPSSVVAGHSSVLHVGSSRWSPPPPRVWLAAPKIRHGRGWEQRPNRNTIVFEAPPPLEQVCHLR